MSGEQLRHTMCWLRIETWSYLAHSSYLTLFENVDGSGKIDGWNDWVSFYRRERLISIIGRPEKRKKLRFKNSMSQHLDRFRQRCCVAWLKTRTKGITFLIHLYILLRYREAPQVHIHFFKKRGRSTVARRYWSLTRYVHWNSISAVRCSSRTSHREKQFVPILTLFSYSWESAIIPRSLKLFQRHRNEIMFHFCIRSCITHINRL